MAASLLAADRRVRPPEVRGYNGGAMLLHWAIALCVLFQLGAGFAMSRLDALPDALRFALFQWHKTVGLMVLTLTVARVVWRLLNPPPAPLPMNRVEAAAAHLVHALFYGLMVLVPLTGWVLVSVSPTRIPTLLFLSEHLPWPSLPLPASEAGEGIAEASHLLLAYLMGGLIVLHVAGALKHSVLDRQPSLSRILPARGLARQPTALLAIPLAAALAASFLAGGVSLGRNAAAAPAPVLAEDAPATAPAAATGSAWVIDKAASTLRYEVPFSGKTIGGEVARWEAAVVFDPADPGAAFARVTLDAASLDIGDAFVRGNLAGADGLDVAAHPTILLAFDRFLAKGTGFEAAGTVEIKGRTAPISLAFTFERQPGGGAHVVGQADLDRLAFGLGAKNDPSGAYLGKTVTVRLDLKARPAKVEPQG